MVSPVQTILRAFLRLLPERAQRAASKWYFFRQIKNRSFRSDEAEWRSLANWLQPGDWCIDVGANVGRYSLKMSELVGAAGQVIAFEPLTRTFDLLTHFVEKGGYRNITLLNAAATEQSCLIHIAADPFPVKAHLFDTNTGSRVTSSGGAASDSKLGLSIDSLRLSHRIALVKMDVEGHELAVCKGMKELILRDYPVLIVEVQHAGTGVPEFLEELGYRGERASENSRNLVFTKR